MTVHSTLELDIEKPVAGGRMLARHEGLVVLVSGAVPGERVRARVERVARKTVWAETVDVIRGSEARRETTLDAACGGQVYAHIRYDAQCQFKGVVVLDAFRRIGKIALETAPVVAPSVEQGYRTRARLRVRQGRAGFFLEGTHTLCDAGSTGQLLPRTVAAVRSIVERLADEAARCDSVLVAESVTETTRVLHVEPHDGERIDASRLAGSIVGVTGVTVASRGNTDLVWGSDRVIDTAGELFGGAPPVPPDVRWSRRATAFFQGNRYLTGDLVRAVLANASGDSVADLYAGVGLFSVALAARGAVVTAVEGDAVSAEDLLGNAEPFGPRIEVQVASVESAVIESGFDTVIVDPPRTGLSPRALAVVSNLGAARVVYVSCDPATLARDAALLQAAQFQLVSLQGFDLFPNTAHIECLAVFDRRP